MEPPALSGNRGPRPRTSHSAERSSGFDLTIFASRSALAAASLAACAVGLTGPRGGLLWIIAGVFTVRSLVGAAPGAAWAIACIGAGQRWGTLGLSDLEVATRLFAPTIGAGNVGVRGGMAIALAGALAGEARAGGLTAETWVERGAALAAVITLVPTFVVSGPRDLLPAAGMWAAAGAGGVLTVVTLRPFARTFPAWLPATLAAAGVVAAQVAA